MSQLCPVCDAPIIERGRDQDYGERRQYDCPRCGQFAITSSVVGSLRNRRSEDGAAGARLSHQIRLASDGGNPLVINSYNVEGLLSKRLPEPEMQVSLLLRFISELAGEDAGGVAVVTYREASAAIAKVGSTSIENVWRIIDDAVADGFLRKKDETPAQTELSITAEGRRYLRAAQDSGPQNTETKVTEGSVTLPDWISRLPNESLQKLLHEVYSARNSGLLALPLMGARAAFDCAMDIKLGEDLGNFEAKMQAMKAAGHLNDRGIGILRPMIDAGHAAAHRAWFPTEAVLTGVLTELEHVLRDWFVRDATAAAVRTATPPRPSR